MTSNATSNTANDDTIESLKAETRENKEKFDRELEEALQEVRDLKDYLLMNALEQGFTVEVNNNGNQAG